MPTIQTMPPSFNWPLTVSCIIDDDMSFWHALPNTLILLLHIHITLYFEPCILYNTTRLIEFFSLFQCQTIIYPQLA